MRYFPILLLLGIGLSFNNTLAVLEALAGRRSTFHRTPKFNVSEAGERWAQRQYALEFSWESVGELAVMGYAIIGMLGVWETGQVWMVPFMALYAAGFGYVAALSLWQSRLRALGRRERAEIKVELNA